MVAFRLENFDTLVITIYYQGNRLLSQYKSTKIVIPPFLLTRFMNVEVHFYRFGHPPFLHRVDFHRPAGCRYWQLSLPARNLSAKAGMASAI